MIGQKGPGRYYPGETCWHTDENGKRDCKEPRRMIRQGTARSTLCHEHDLERERKNGRESKRRIRARKNGTILPVEIELGSPWDIEKGKGAGICITPGCHDPQYNNTSRCKGCGAKQKVTDRPSKAMEQPRDDDEGEPPRRISTKPPVLPYSFRAFTWKGTLSEELRNGR